MRSDDQIITRVRGGERSLFAELVDRHEVALYAYARSRGLSAADAQDVAQDAFVEAYLSLHRYEEGTDFGAWLRAIARNLVQNRLRSLSRRREAAFLEGSVGAAEPAPPTARLLEALKRCLEASDALGKELVEEFYGRALSLREIAKRLGRSVSWVGVTLHRTRNRLRDCLRRSGAEEPS
jgi:RNA polymerase sigma-70 factor (ECF subfamily)